MNSLLLGLAHLRKSESVSGHVPVLFICCEYHFLDTINIRNNEFLIPTHIIMPGQAGELSDHFC